MPKRLSKELEREVRRLAAKGHGLREIGRMVECSKHAVSNVLTREPPSAATDWNPSPARLSMKEREEIRAGLERGETFTAIAGLIGRAVSTVSREVAANGGREGYRGRRTGMPASEPGGRRLRSWPAVDWPRRSPSGCRNGGRRRRSPAGCASSSPTIR